MILVLNLIYCCFCFPTEVDHGGFLMSWILIAKRNQYNYIHAPPRRNFPTQNAMLTWIYHVVMQRSSGITICWLAMGLLEQVLGICGKMQLDLFFMVMRNVCNRSRKQIKLGYTYIYIYICANVYFYVRYNIMDTPSQPRQSCLLLSCIWPRIEICSLVGDGLLA